jgi:hypothetical protein
VTIAHGAVANRRGDIEVRNNDLTRSKSAMDEFDEDDLFTVCLR